MAGSSEPLRDLQLRFQRYLETGDPQFEHDIVGSDDAQAGHRLAAYYNAYRLRLIDCLETDFPVLCKTVGEDAFENLVLDYLKQFPSRHPSVRWVGQHMEQFLRQGRRDKHDFLAELAAFEWGQGLCFDAPDTAQHFTLEEMAGIDPALWPAITLEFDPSLRWLDLVWNVPPYWVATDQYAGEAVEPLQDSIPTRWLMWRRGFKPNWRSLDVAEAWVIEAALNGANFAQLCEGLLEWISEEQVALTAAGYLKQWISDELVCVVHT
jgi:hypothetical protein